MDISQISRLGQRVQLAVWAHHLFAFYRGQVKPKRRRAFTHHAMRWKRGMAAGQAGELMQIDHMSVGFVTGFMVKEFKASCPVTGMTFMRAYSRATSRNATCALWVNDFYNTWLNKLRFMYRDVLGR